MDEYNNGYRLMTLLENNLPTIYDNWLQTHIAEINKNDLNNIAVDSLPRTFVLSVSDGHKKAKTVTFIADGLATERWRE